MLLELALGLRQPPASTTTRVGDPLRVEIELRGRRPLRLLGLGLHVGLHVGLLGLGLRVGLLGLGLRVGLLGLGLRVGFLDPLGILALLIAATGLPRPTKEFAPALRVCAAASGSSSPRASPNF